MKQFATSLNEARETREQLPIHQKGTIPAFYDVFIDIPDSPGIIGEITSLLGMAALSTYPMRILETRENFWRFTIKF